LIPAVDHLSRLRTACTAAAAVLLTTLLVLALPGLGPLAPEVSDERTTVLLALLLALLLAWRRGT